MDVLINKVKQIRDLDPNVVIDKLLKQEEFKKFIIQLNTEGLRTSQLFEAGINSLGVKLEDIGGSYSAFTIEEKKRKGQRFDHVTLRDTGDFYQSWKVRINPNDIEITADPIKEDTNLFTRWSKEIVGLTEDHLQLLINKLRNELIEAVRKEILT